MLIPTLTAAFLAVTFALWKGGWEERLGACVVVAMIAMKLLFTVFVPPSLHSVDIVGLIPDIVGFLAFVSISLHCKGLWPLWASSLQLLSLGAHLIRALEVAIGQQAYYLLKSVPTDLILVVLVIGTIQYQRRQHGSGNASSSPS